MSPPQRDFDSALQSKKKRGFEYAPKNPNQNQHGDSGLLPPPAVYQELLSQTDRTNKLFFKTRLCMKFKMGTCPYGQNCSFAHGLDELRDAPPNWPSLVAYDDRNDRQLLNRLKICRKYYSGQVCPYGERCTFPHVEPGSLRKNSAISRGVIDPAAPPTGTSVNVGCECDTNGSSGFNVEGRSSFWKTKICHKWELTGDCPFGENCQFAHGASADTKKSAGHTDDNTNCPVAHSKRGSSGPGVGNIPPDEIGSPEKQNGFPRLKRLKKINGIYADWPDDMLLLTSRNHH